MTAVLKETSAPALTAFEVARAIIAGDASMPKTRPLAPTWRLATIASVPVPHPMSRTDSPGMRCARATSCSRKARSLRCVKSQTSRSYPAAQCRTRPVVEGAVSVDECMAVTSVDLHRTAVKNTQSRPVRKRTSGPKRPETRDRRVRRTKASLHDALIGLAREKPYPSIAVKEILDRANVGRSTFYTHFRDKDNLLESAIHEILGSLQDEPRVGSPLERLVAFSLPLLKHIDEHRRAAGPRMKREGRVIMHEHLKGVLTPLITDELATALAGKPGPPTPTDLVARHVASTFVLVLNWWVDRDSALTPANVDACFRELVVPILTTPSIEVG